MERREPPVSKPRKKPSRRDALRTPRAGSAPPKRGTQRQGEHTTTGREVEREIAERERFEDLTNEPTREGDEQSAGATDVPENLEALGDVPIGGEDEAADKPTQEPQR
jgi:hypothetical protein